MGLPISIIIPAYQNVEDLNRCISSIFNSNYNDYEIVVVDDASNPSLSKLLIKDPRIRYIYQAKQAGAAAARNLGVEKSKYNIIYFVDSDVEISKPNLRRLDKHF